MIEQPADLQAAEVGAERQPGLRAKAVRPAVAGKLGDVVIYPRVLPDQRVGYWLAGLTVPKHRGLALIGDADGGEIGSVTLRPLQSLRNDVLGGPPDLLGIMLDPSRLGIDLLMLFLRGSDNLAGSVEHAEARAGCSLIDRADVVGHGWIW